MGAAALPAALGLQVGGSLLQAQSELDSGRQKEAYYNYLARQSENQANLAEIEGQVNAHSIADAAAYTLARQKRDLRRIEGTQRAALAEKGISGGGTADDIARDTRREASLDEMAIRYNADQKASSILRQASMTAYGLRSQAYGYRDAGHQERSASKKRAFSTLLGGATSVASTLAYNKAGKR